jgi:cytochrome b6-f complex iron-sulfur subunit
MSVTPSSAPDRIPPLERRGFLAVATRVLLWATGGAAAAALGRYLSYEPPSSRSGPVTLEPARAYPTGTRLVVAEAGAALFRDARGFFARSLTCVHLGCRVGESDGGFACPCHGSHFTREGARMSGPAGRDLDGLALRLDEQGRLVLDGSTRVDSSWRLPAPTAQAAASQPDDDGRGREG